MSILNLFVTILVIFAGSGSANNPCSKTVCLSKEIFGYLQNDPNQPIHKFIWKNKNNVQVEILNYGLTLARILVPDIDGKTEDILLGFDTIEGYTSSVNPYFGATIGRVANRIANGQFSIDEKTYQLPRNLGNNTIHGGIKGFDKYIWDYLVKDNEVIFTLMVPDGDEGFPGGVLVTATIQLTERNELKFDITAMSTKKTPINLTNHAYFNLGGHASGFESLQSHGIKIEADSITATTDDGIPTGEFIIFADSPTLDVYDFRQACPLSQKFQLKPDGYDNNYCVNGFRDVADSKPRFMASAHHWPSGRFLELFSNQPGVQFFTAGNLPNPNEEDPEKIIIGKNGTRYSKFGAFCFEPQGYPDAVNHPNFPSTILSPGEVYSHKIWYRFGNFS